MPKRSTHGDRIAFIRPESITGEPRFSIQPGQPVCLTVSHSGADSTADEAAEDEAVLFRPRLYCVPED
jgi:hypothetical protein